MLAASMAPRVRIDTSVQIFDFAGNPVKISTYSDDDLLYGVGFLQRNITENELFASEITFDESQIASAKKLGDSAAVLTGNSHMAKAYVPPHLRNIKPVEEETNNKSSSKNNKKKNYVLDDHLELYFDNFQ